MAMVQMKTFDKRLYITCVVAAFVVIAFSNFDLFVSSLFYEKGIGFVGKNSDFCKFFHKDWMLVIYGLPALCVGFWLGGKINKQSVCAVKNKTLAFVIASGLVIPGLIINGIFKEFWGRARPRDIVDFGGEALFTSPLVISEQCGDNCSFPSGRVAAAAWCLAIALILPKPLRKLGIMLVFVMAGVVAYTRIAMGAHFLSDTLFSLIIVVPLVLYMWRKFGLDKDQDNEEKA